MIIVIYIVMLINQKQQQQDGLYGLLMRLSQSVNQVIFKFQLSS